jgi:hypothetical protein
MDSQHAPLQQWLTALSRHYDAELSARAGAWSIDGSSNAWAAFIDDFLTEKEKEAKRKPHSWTVRADPENVFEWRDRFRLVERAAARELTSRPVAFTASVSPRAKKARTVVRLAFGLSLSLGTCHRCRFTACVADGKTTLRVGDDELFSLAPQIAPLDLHRKELRAALPQLLVAVAEAQAAYRQDAKVVAEIESMRRRYVEDSLFLDRLYNANSASDPRLMGDPPEGLKGDDAIEAEYVMRLEDLVDRYRPRVLFEPLTIGIVEGFHLAA